MEDESMPTNPSFDKTIKLPPIQKAERSVVERTPLPPATIDVHKTSSKKLPPAKISKRDRASTRMLQDRCRHLCLSIFSHDESPVRSLGFTSSIQGEGKSFLALITAQILAHDSGEPVTLVECNWEHPTLHTYFNIPSTPGLAEWLLGICQEEEIRYQVDNNLTVIPAGDGSRNPVKLLKQMHELGLRNMFGYSKELFIVDLPPIITTGYGALAASLLESIIVVARAQVTPESIIAETCRQLKDTPIHGIILNQSESRIPRWIRQLL
jgi:protein-tyrosine kinase